MRVVLPVFVLIFLSGCTIKQNADFILFNATIHTQWDSLPQATHMAVKDGKVLLVGNEREVMGRYDATDMVNAGGRDVFPGFADAHCHFFGYAEQLGKVNVSGTRSFAEVVEKVKEFALQHPDGWITGRGWDQNDWADQSFPVNSLLNEAFPDRPVFLKRIDGHAAIANDAALKAAGINASTVVKGGVIFKSGGELTGVLLDNAVDLVDKVIPATPRKVLRELLRKASLDCAHVGLTSLTDAGLDAWQVLLIDSLQQEGIIRQRMNIMLNPKPENFKWVKETGGIETQMLRVKSFKIYADGALGSRGALLKEPYNDDPHNQGLLLTPLDTLASIYDFCLKHNFQAATHCIGDSAVALVLKLYAERLKGVNDKRWRIEHAQVVDPRDLHYFRDYTIVPSVQPVHAMSDMDWAEDRMGARRIKGAYAYATLLKQMGLIAMGSDFPVEHINPLYGYQAVVGRINVNGQPQKGWHIEEKISRQEGVKGMTIWAAIANFSESFTGSLEPGKVADFVVPDQNILTIKPVNISSTGIVIVYLNGKKINLENDGKEIGFQGE